MLNLLTPTDLHPDAAVAIASGMHRMANVDEEFDAKERAVIAAFLKELNVSEVPDSVELRHLNDPASQALFLQSLAVVALSDGSIKKEAIALLQSYIDALGAHTTAQAEIRKVARRMLAHFKGIFMIRTQAEMLGMSLGLSDEDIAEVLKE